MTSYGPSCLLRPEDDKAKRRLLESRYQFRRQGWKILLDTLPFLVLHYHVYWLLHYKQMLHFIYTRRVQGFLPLDSQYQHKVEPTIWKFDDKALCVIWVCDAIYTWERRLIIHGYDKIYWDFQMRAVKTSLKMVLAHPRDVDALQHPTSSASFLYLLVCWLYIIRSLGPLWGPTYSWLRQWTSICNTHRVS